MRKEQLSRRTYIGLLHQWFRLEEGPRSIKKEYHRAFGPALVDTTETLWFVNGVPIRGELTELDLRSLRPSGKKVR